MTIGVYNESAMLIGVGGLNLWKSVENWTQFNIPIQYLMENQPATTIISISLIDTSDSGTNLDVLGSTAFIDNLVLGDPTNISDNMSNRLSFKLNQNYPNPFNPVTKIKFTIPDGDVNNQYVNLNVFDILGRKIASLINGKKNPGSYEVIFNGSNYPSGIYFYELRYGEMKSVRKMILTK